MTKIIKHTLYIGLNDQATKQQEIGTVDCIKIINKILLKYYDGGTISQATGIYKHADGTFTVENSIKLEILFANKKNTLDLIQELKFLLNQETIALEIQESNSKLI